MGKRGKSLGRISSKKLGAVKAAKTGKTKARAAKAILFVTEGVSPKKQELNIQVVAIDPKNFATMAMRRS